VAVRVATPTETLADNVTTDSSAADTAHRRDNRPMAPGARELAGTTRNKLKANCCSRPHVSAGRYGLVTAPVVRFNVSGCTLV
jgi:hypothetical protein